MLASSIITVYMWLDQKREKNSSCPSISESQIIYQIHTGLETTWQLLGNHWLLGK